MKQMNAQQLMDRILYDSRRLFNERRGRAAETFVDVLEPLILEVETLNLMLPHENVHPGRGLHSMRLIQNKARYMDTVREQVIYNVDGETHTTTVWNMFEQFYKENTTHAVPTSAINY
jgi:hypothetical protein